MSIPILMKVKEFGVTAEKLTQGQLNAILKDGWGKVGQQWHIEMRPEHFKNSATNKYGYKKRQGERGSGVPFRRSYTEKKLRKYGHTKPLVLSGESERQTKLARIVNTKSGVKVRMGARKLNYVEGAHAELTKIIPAEAKTLTKTLDQHVDREINRGN